MALNPTLSYPVQDNDAKTLILTDNTGDYDAVTNTDGWGNPNTDYADIDLAGTSALELDITITTSDGTETTYDTIDFYTYNGGSPDNYEDIEWIITCAELKVSGVAIGTTDDELPDGWWDVTYGVTKDLTGGAGDAASYDYNYIIDGHVRKLVYQQLAAMPNYWDHAAEQLTTSEWLEILNPLKAYSYLKALTRDVYYFHYNYNASEQTEVLNILSTLEDLT